MKTTAMLAAAMAATAEARFYMYFDQYHTADPPTRDQTVGITHVVTAFANSSLFTTSPAGVYTPFMDLTAIRAMFQNGTEICMSIGGWADNDGFGQAVATDASRQLWAKNVAAAADQLGYDCVDIDWEYPGGNGADYRQKPNSEKTYEIDGFPLLLQELKAALGNKELSITVPGLERDMLAFNATQVPKINAHVDFVNVMTYDLMNRRDNETNHHTSVKGSEAAIDKYLELGFPAEKLILGFAFYAKWFTTAEGVNCTQPVGCPTALLEAADGSDTGLSGAFTFEKQSLQSAPDNLTVSSDQSCGPGTSFKCDVGFCCSQYGFCGNTPAHCGTGCWSEYGVCNGTSTSDSFKLALKHGQTDDAEGGQWWWDASNRIFWTWDTPELISRKMNEIFKAKGIGGVMAWSLVEDSFDWSHLKAIQAGLC